MASMRIYQVCLQLHPIRALGTGFAIETTPGDVHKSTPLPDTAEEVFAPGDKFPFL